MKRSTRQMLEYKAYQLRVDSIRATTAAGSGHPTSCLSAADIVAVLFFKVMHYNPHNPSQINNDRFILSKGHAAPLLYAAFKQLGVVSDEQLLTLRQINSVLEGHPTFRFYYAEAATGSLGCGLSIGLGIALANQLNQQDCYTYVLLGDSECSEGSVWEAVQLAAHYKTHKLIAIVDVNRLGQANETIDGYTTDHYKKKFTAFAWNVLQVDGHSIADLIEVFEQAHQYCDGPTVIIAKTVKGYGIKSVENKPDFHGKVFKPEELQDILQELKDRFVPTALFQEDSWQLNLPEFNDEQIVCSDFILPVPIFSGATSTRKAYGQAITVAASVCQSVVCFDAEVKNSTFAQLFEDEHPFRFFESFIAEQNMVGMAIGMTRMKKISFVSTFAAFLTRAFDQLRMAAIGKNPLRIAGSHVGVSIGQDGPSQMGLEDIAMMRTLPGSVILYPSDAVSTFKLVQLMANYHQGISYIRLTREATPILYDQTENFQLGGCKVLRQPEGAQALLIAAGITLHEALKAADLLLQESIPVAVIDLYCIKPLDAQTLIIVAQKAQKGIITIEDHYLEGGFGQAVAAAVINQDIKITQLAVTTLPRSGTPEELRAMVKIDAHAIMEAVKG
jgi:transketolase